MEFRELGPFQINQLVWQLPTTALCGSKPSQMLIGKFEMASMLQIPLVTEFGTDYIVLMCLTLESAVMLKKEIGCKSFVEVKGFITHHFAAIIYNGFPVEI